VVTVVAVWKPDPVACGGMEIGAPRVEVTGLVDLRRLLIERGFRRNSPRHGHDQAFTAIRALIERIVVPP
jgi:hypothetical protein